MAASRQPGRRTVIQAGMAGMAGAVGTLAAANPLPASASESPSQSASEGGRRRPGDLRVLVWNIYEGGRGQRVGGAPNLPRLLDQVAAIAPDVFLCVETYGAGPAITRTLSRRAGRGRYRGVQITDRPAGEDNLWIFTHLPIVRVLPKPTGGEHVTDFNLGGIRVRTPNGGTADMFVMWISYTDPWDGYLVDENAAGRRAGLSPRHSAQDVLHAERLQSAYIREIVHQHLPRMREGHDGPMVIGGDCNTLPAADWTEEWADGPNRLGSSYGFTATRQLTDAGLVDTFRVANPDVHAVEGSTWTPLPDERLITPQRIDMAFASRDVVVRSAHTVDSRMRQHGPGAFYSDHAAVVTDLRLRS